MRSRGTARDANFCQSFIIEVFPIQHSRRRFHRDERMKEFVTRKLYRCLLGVIRADFGEEELLTPRGLNSGEQNSD